SPVERHQAQSGAPCRRQLHAAGGGHPAHRDRGRWRRVRPAGRARRGARRGHAQHGCARRAAGRQPDRLVRRRGNRRVRGSAFVVRSNGYLIAVDDFGTGYSNLRSVTRLAPDRLKIDRSFVHELEEASLRSNLIPEMVDIARAINAQIIAEGIETMNQARLLTVAGVRYGQGYCLARPMPADALGAMMRQYFATA